MYAYSTNTYGRNGRRPYKIEVRILHHSHRDTPLFYGFVYDDLINQNVHVTRPCRSDLGAIRSAIKWIIG